jgi:hypothetical protein
MTTTQNDLGQLLRRNQKRRKIHETKRLLFISCLGAGPLIASPSFGKPAKKSAGMSQSKIERVAPQTTQVTRNDRHNQNISPRMGSTRYYGGTRYSGTRSYAGRQYAGRVTTAAHATVATIMGAAPAITTAVDRTRTTATPRAGRLRGGVTARRGDTPRIRAMAAIRTVVTPTTTRNTRQRTVITHQWLQLCSGALANSVTIAA